MRTSDGFRIGKVAGIPIVLHPTFLISFVMVTGIFALRILPNRVDPDPSDTTTILLSLLGGVAFFVSLLLHELAHSVVAKGYGMRVRNITLFLLGGVSQIMEESKTARQEFLIAFVGPATSAVLGGIFLGVFYAMGRTDSSLAAVVEWLGFINIVLAIFNMLPGFPLDGGRVFRAGLWGILRSRDRATRYASRVGQVMGAGMAFGGLALLFLDISDGAGGINGVWLILIGGFLYNNAAQSHRAAAAQERLESVIVRDVMSTRLRQVEADTSVRWLAPARESIDHTLAYLVSEGDTVVGILTGAQIAILDEETYTTANVRDVMINATTIAPILPSATGQEALVRLQEGKTPVLPVVEDGRLLGLVGLEQMVAALRNQPQATATS
ncbi:MAG TPA: site-2 protease family protein [Dehalococcoidia bacterium]|nr:site-2 protease family protein [Dehalococcoidia bacterium]